MNKFSKYLSALFLAVTLATAVGCASTSKQEGTGEYVDDSVITTKVKGQWEYVSRARGIKAAVILATVEDDVLLVEQFRVPLGKSCLELPAGLIGDEEEGEAIELAASREVEKLAAGG